MKKIFLFGSLALLMLFSSCSEKGKSLLPTVTGSAFDMLVVGSPKAWNDSAGRSLQEVFTAPIPCLPEAEANFNVIFIPVTSFDHVVKPARNIFFYEIDPNRYTKGSIHFSEDLWAHPQAVVKVTAPDQHTFIETVKENQTKILRFFTTAEEERALNYYKSYQNMNIEKQVQSLFGVGMIVPGNLDKSKVGKNFIWISNANPDMTQNLLVYSRPYGSTRDFEVKRLLAVQDSFTRIYVPGPSRGSYIAFEPKVQPVSEVLDNDYSDYCVEVRGLWRCIGDVMGGPFVSRSYLSADHKNIITSVAFIYGPGHDKRNVLRMLEASAGSLRVKSAQSAPADSIPDKK
jgi:hypothetical protein